MLFVVFFSLNIISVQRIVCNLVMARKDTSTASSKSILRIQKVLTVLTSALGRSYCSEGFEGSSQCTVQELCVSESKRSKGHFIILHGTCA